MGKALSKAPQLNHNSAWVTVIRQRFYRVSDADPVGGEGEKEVNIRSTRCAPVEVFSFSLYPLLITLLADPHLKLKLLILFSTPFSLILS